MQKKVKTVHPYDSYGWSYTYESTSEHYGLINTYKWTSSVPIQKRNANNAINWDAKLTSTVEDQSAAKVLSASNHQMWHGRRTEEEEAWSAAGGEEEPGEGIAEGRRSIQKETPSAPLLNFKWKGIFTLSLTMLGAPTILLGAPSNTQWQAIKFLSPCDHIHPNNWSAIVSCTSKLLVAFLLWLPKTIDRLLLLITFYNYYKFWLLK